MKPIQWLLIGGDGHGKTLWIKQGSRLAYPRKDSYETLLYEGQNYLSAGQLFRIGTHRATHEQMAQIPKLIAETHLAALAGDA